MPIDVAIAADRNVIKKQAGRILKYEYRTIEIQSTWNVKEKAIPIITERLEPSQNHSNIPGKHEIEELQKLAILFTAHRLREVLI
jgi:hypothetical protein